MALRDVLAESLEKIAALCEAASADVAAKQQAADEAATKATAAGAELAAAQNEYRELLLEKQDLEARLG